jgi:DtxR family Mn-dependent transcriptional regulator
MERQTHGSLAALDEGDEATVRRVPDGDAELLRYLDEVGLVPGRRVRLQSAAPFQGPLTVKVGGRERAISRELAARISVS